MAATPFILDQTIQVRIKAYIKGDIGNGTAKSLGVQGSIRTAAVDIFPQALEERLKKKAGTAFEQIQAASSPLFFRDFNLESNIDDIRPQIEALFINQGGKLKPEYVAMLNELDPKREIFQEGKIDGESFTREQWFARCLVNWYLGCCKHYFGHLVEQKMADADAWDRGLHFTAWQHPHTIDAMIGANLFSVDTSIPESSPVLSRSQNTPDLSRSVSTSASSSSTAIPGLSHRSLNLSQKRSSSDGWPRTCQRMPAGRGESIKLNPGVMYVKYFATGGLLCSYIDVNNQRIDIRISREKVDSLSAEARAQLAQIENSKIGTFFSANTLLAELSALNHPQKASKAIQYAENLKVRSFDQFSKHSDKKKDKQIKEETYAGRKTTPKHSYGHNLANDVREKTADTFLPSIMKNLKKAYSTLGKSVAPELAWTLPSETLKRIKEKKQRLKNGRLTPEERVELRQRIELWTMQQQRIPKNEDLILLEAKLRADLRVDLKINAEKEPIRMVQRELQKSINYDLDIIQNALYQGNDKNKVLHPILQVFQKAIEKNSLSSLTMQELVEIKTRLSFLRDLYSKFNDKGRIALGGKALQHISFQHDIEHMGELLRIVNMAIDAKSSKKPQRSFASSFMSIFSSDKEVDEKWLVKTEAEWKRDYGALGEKTIRRWEKENSALFKQYIEIRQTPEKNEGEMADISSTPVMQSSSSLSTTPTARESLIIPLVGEQSAVLSNQKSEDEVGDDFSTTVTQPSSSSSTATALDRYFATLAEEPGLDLPPLSTEMPQPVNPGTSALLHARPSSPTSRYAIFSAVQCRNEPQAGSSLTTSPSPSLKKELGQ